MSVSRVCKRILATALSWGFVMTAVLASDKMDGASRCGICCSLHAPISFLYSQTTWVIPTLPPMAARSAPRRCRPWLNKGCGSRTTIPPPTARQPERCYSLAWIATLRASRIFQNYWRPSNAHMPQYQGELGDNVVTVATLFEGNGYHTYMAGKWHLGSSPEKRPSRRGFERTVALMDSGADNWEQRPYMPLYDRGQLVRRRRALHFTR